MATEDEDVDERELAIEALASATNKYVGVPMKFRRDAVEFMLDNRRTAESLDELSPDKFLKYVLHWQGIVGYADDIIQLMESLGWQRPKPVVVVHPRKLPSNDGPRKMGESYDSMFKD